MTSLIAHEETGLPFSCEYARIYDLTLLDAGWPFDSFRGGMWTITRFVDGYVLPPSSGLRDRVWYLQPANDYEFSPLMGFGRLIPLVPKWPGFTLNTIFYGGLLYLLVRRLSALRRLLVRAKSRAVETLPEPSATQAA